MNNKEIHNRIKNSKKEANKIWDELFYCEEIEVSTKKSNKKNVHNTVKKDVPPVAKTKKQGGTKTWYYILQLNIKIILKMTLKLTLGAKQNLQE